MSEAKTIVVASHANLYPTGCLRQVAHSATAYLVPWTVGYCQWCFVGFSATIG